jgi:hypothetical protein
LRGDWLSRNKKINCPRNLKHPSDEQWSRTDLSLTDGETTSGLTNTLADGNCAPANQIWLPDDTGRRPGTALCRDWV